MKQCKNPQIASLSNKWFAEVTNICTNEKEVGQKMEVYHSSVR